jgi:adenosylhomocysteine nucleosidase
MTHSLAPLNLLIVMALPVEAQGVFDDEGVKVVFTGIGKVNAAYHLTRALNELRNAGSIPNLVVNFGTAGSPVHLTGTVLECTGFVQRDMDVTGLGFALGETPFEDTPAILTLDAVFHQLPKATCATADRFETQSDRTNHELFDMEAYALAKVCYLEGVSFACAKYVTDGADHSSASSWEANLPSAARAFLALYRELKYTAV